MSQMRCGTLIKSPSTPGESKNTLTYSLTFIFYYIMRKNANAKSLKFVGNRNGDEIIAFAFFSDNISPSLPSPVLNSYARSWENAAYNVILSR